MSLKDANKFVRLNNQISALESERDRLAMAVEARDAMIDRLKAELERFKYTTWRWEKLNKDRDLWKSKYNNLLEGKTQSCSMCEMYTRKAQKLAEALRKIEKLDPEVDTDQGFNEWGQAECFEKSQHIAKEALEDKEAK